MNESVLLLTDATIKNMTNKKEKWRTVLTIWQATTPVSGDIGGPTPSEKPHPKCCSAFWY
jgi:hypothetical protein